MKKCGIRIKGKDGKVIPWQLQSVALDTIEGKDGISFPQLLMHGCKQLEEALQKAHDKLELAIRSGLGADRANVQLNRK